jgi:Cohesin domain
MKTRNTVLKAALALCLWTGSAHAMLVRIDAPPTATMGGSFDVNIVIDDALDLYAFQFDVTFDPSVLQATAVNEGALLPTGGATFFLPGVIDNSAGSISANSDSLIGFVPGVGGNGALISITFQAIAVGTSALTLSNVSFLDSALADIAVPSAANVEVNVLKGATVPLPASLLLLTSGLALLVERKRSGVTSSDSATTARH